MAKNNYNTNLYKVKKMPYTTNSSLVVCGVLLSGEGSTMVDTDKRHPVTYNFQEMARTKEQLEEALKIRGMDGEKIFGECCEMRLYNEVEKLEREKNSMLDESDGVIQ